MSFNLIKARGGYKNIMFVRNATKDLKQHDLSMHTILRVGSNFLKIDTIETMESCYVGNATMDFIENISMKLLQNRSY